MTMTEIVKMLDTLIESGDYTATVFDDDGRT